jgi:hypothetical protein
MYPIKKRGLSTALSLALLVWVLCSTVAAPAFHSAEEETPWDLSYLLEADPATVTAGDLYDRAVFAEENYQAYHSVNGIIWKGIFEDTEDEHPSLYGTGGDSAIFTGFYLAAAVYRFLITGEEADLDIVFQTIRGLHILTHASGTPGVILRCAFPADQTEKWRYPDAWRSRIEAGFVYESPDNISDIGDPSDYYPAFIFYTRATKDQLTGILYGLGVALAELDPDEYKGNNNLYLKAQAVRSASRKIIDALWTRLEESRFVIKDHHNKTGSTAILVTGLLKVQLLAVYRKALEEFAEPDDDERLRIEKLYSNEFKAAFFLNDGNFSSLFNRSSLTGSYYSNNLRFARSFTVHLLEEDADRKEKVVEYMKKHVWQYVNDHRNTHFIFLYSTASSDESKLKDGVLGLQELSLRPLRNWSSPLYDQNFYPPPLILLYGDVSDFVVPVHLRAPTGYFIWQKDPYKTGDSELETEGKKEATGLDFILPYWMGRYYGFLDPPLDPS